MDNDKYNEILKKISNVTKLMVTPNMNINTLTQNELLLVHTLLHRFYPRGTKNLSKQNIEKLHELVKYKINHVQFDQLDEVNIYENTSS